MNTYKKSFQGAAKSPNVLFADDTVVIHISGNKENPGQILRASQGLLKVFEYTKTEVINHSISILMPQSFGKRHSDFLKNFFKTGHKTVFNTERTLYGMKRNGYCFCIVLFVKQLPKLNEGIQYVGMMREVKNNCEYILTDSRGVIECVSQRVISMLCLSENPFRDTPINIQIIAPELLKVFNSADKKKPARTRFQEPGGHRLNFIVPKDFVLYTQHESKKNMREMNRSARDNESLHRKSKQPSYFEYNKNLNKRDWTAGKVTPQTLLLAPEYKDCHVSTTVRCEIVDCVYGEKIENAEPLVVKVFKLSGLEASPGESVEPSSVASPYNESWSNTLYDPKDMKEEIRSKEEKKELTNLILKDSPIEEKNQEGRAREDTKVTEKLPGNLITTDERIETTEVKIQLPSTPVNARENINEGFGQYVEDEKLVVEKEEEEESSSTPRVDIGDLKGPEAPSSRFPEIGTFNQPDDLLNNESLNSFGQINFSGSKRRRETKVYTHVSSGRLNEELRSRSTSKDPNKPGTMMESKTLQKEKAKNAEVFTRGTAKPSPLEFFPSDSRIGATLKKNFGRSIGDLKLERSDSDIKVRGGKSEILGGPFKSSGERPGLRGTRRMLSKKFSVRDFRVKPLESQKNVARRESRKSKASAMLQKPNRCKNICDAPFDPDKMEPPAYKPNEEEMKLRRSLLAFTNQRNRERAKESKQQKDKEKKHTNEENEEDVKESEEKDESEEVSSKEENEDRTAEDFDDGEGPQNSVASSSVGNRIRSLYSLRAAIDEEYIPPSIRSIRYALGLIFLVILSISICYFTIELVLYGRLQQSVDNISHVKDRFENIVNINLHTLDMMIISADYVQHVVEGIPESEPSFIDEPVSVTSEQFAVLQEKLKTQANLLKAAQIELSVNNDRMSPKADSQINNGEIAIYQMDVPKLPSSYYYTMWQSIMELIVSAYHIATLDISAVDYNTSATVYFVLTNSLNSILEHLDVSAVAVVDEADSRISYMRTMFLILLLAASAVFLLLVIIAIPIISKVNKNKQEVLELFMHVKKQNATEELGRCRKFLGSIQPNQETELLAEGEDLEQEEEDAADRMKHIGKDGDIGASRRKYKKLVLNLGLSMAKFVVIVMALEGYFILSYFLLMGFLNRVQSLAREIDSLIYRFPSDSLLLLVEKYVVWFMVGRLYLLTLS